MDQLRIRDWIKKYRYVFLVLLAGVLLMLLPEGTEEKPEPIAEQVVTEDMETRLAQILSRIEGAGEVAVMLTEASGAQTIYQTEGEDQRTVLITDAQRSEQGLIHTTLPPVYLGAIVVCRGADSAAVRLAVVEAVANVTGLGTDKITVLKMK